MLKIIYEIKSIFFNLNKKSQTNENDKSACGLEMLLRWKKTQTNLKPAH